jgi:hypothetical protein
MFDDEMSEYGPPYTLVSACGYGHRHGHSKHIRNTAKDEAITCFMCLYTQDASWLEDSPNDAPCCEL